ncbi:MAG TPA: cbb3-type cytochrome oxidase assembly protein [Steroidobacteraceae bacterium]|jgi:cbb3-type cytochrome oxidase maturation protein
MDITFYMFFSAFLMSMSAWCIFLWAVRTGQFRDVEETKYQLWPKENADVNEPTPKPANA